MASARFGGATGQESLLNRIIAISAIVDIPTSGGIESVADLYIANGARRRGAQWVHGG